MEKELFSDYGIFSVKNSRKKVSGKINISSHGITQTTLMEKLISYKRQIELYEDITEDYHIFIKTIDREKSIILQQSYIDLKSFTNTQHLTTSTCIIFENNITKYNSIYEGKSICSLEIDISQYKSWIDLLFKNRDNILSWDTSIGKITISKKNYSLSEKINLLIYFKIHKTTKDCSEIYDNIYRFFLTFVDYTKEIPYPTIVFKNDEKALLINQKMKNCSVNDSFSSNLIHPDIFKEEFGKCLSTYLLNYKIYNQSYYLYTCRYFQETYIEFLISSLFWGFENLINIYYEKNFNKIKKPKYKKEHVISWLNFLRENGKINSKTKSFLLKKITQENHVDLGFKISMTIKDIYPNFDSKTIQSFVQSLVDMRNDLAHRGGLRPKAEKANYQNMRILLNCLDFFYFSLLMKISGIPKENIPLILQAHYHTHISQYVNIKCLSEVGFKI